MACFENGTVIELPARATVRMPEMRGTTLRVTKGSLWITQHEDSRDVVLRPGDTWVIERDGLTLLEAQSDASFCVMGRHLDMVIARAQDRRSTQHWGHRIADRIASALPLATRKWAPYY